MCAFLIDGERVDLEPSPVTTTCITRRETENASIIGSEEGTLPMAEISIVTRLRGSYMNRLFWETAEATHLGSLWKLLSKRALPDSVSAGRGMFAKSLVMAFLA